MTDSMTTRRSGFTLVEILVVVVILGIASAIVIPQIGARGDLKASAGARVVMADLMYAQNRAIATQTWHYVKFDIASNSYSVLDRVPQGGGDRIISNPVSKNPYTTTFGASQTALADIAINAATFNGISPAFQTKFTIAFDELGTPWVYCYDANDVDEMLDGTIVVRSGTFDVTVTVERYTGEIRVQ